MLPQPGPNPLLEAFLSDPEQAIIGFGHDGAVFLWNQAAELLYGFTQAEVLGKSVACLLPLYELPAKEELLHNPSCIDDLKHINDRYGHLTGNHALSLLARVMKEHCRGTETAARYGGDEFATLLLDANGERAQNVAERISSCLREQTDSPVLSVSIGFSVYPNSWKPPTSASTRARNPVLPASPRPTRNAPSPREPDLAPPLPGCTRFRSGVNSCLVRVSSN
jgi:hypothetical protein